MDDKYVVNHLMSFKNINDVIYHNVTSIKGSYWK